MDTHEPSISTNGSETGAGTICGHGGTLEFGCINTYKVDSQIFWTMVTSGVAGLLCLAAFCFLQTFISVYRGRLLSPQVAIKPPVYTGSGAAKYFYWIWATISMKEKELLATAGMDALMFERLIVFGLQLMGPVTVLSCAALIPLHASRGFLATSVEQLQSNLMGLTMSNVPPGSSTFWVHLFFIWGYCLYAMWLLGRHYQWYVLLRQQYMTRGDSVSTWIGQSSKLQSQSLHSDSVVAMDPASPTEQQLLNPALGYARGTRSEPGTAPAPAAPAVVHRAQSAAAAAAAALKPAAIDPNSKGNNTAELEMSKSAGSQLGSFQRPLTQSVFAAAMSTDDGLFDPSAVSSPTDSRYTSRQSSLKTLLPGGKLAKSSSQHLHGHAVTFSAGAGTGCLDDEESGFGGGVADGATGAASRRSTRGSSTGFTEHLKRIGSIGNWKRKGDSGYSGLEQQEWQRRQRQSQQHRAAAAAAAAAAEKLGADVDWWAFKTGDPLLDKHVVQVDVASDLAWDETPGSASTNRLHLWWELAPADSISAINRSSVSTEGSGADSSGQPTAGAQQQSIAAHKSNICAIPGTRLLFDRRSLRARKPSVRFRNTVHVQGLRGNLMPLHVSNYAVLVTDVPSSDSSYAAEDDDVDADELARHKHRPGLLSWMLQASIWNWPCLLSQGDLSDLAASWNDQRCRVKSKQFSDSMQRLIMQQQEELQQDQDSGASSPPSQQAAESRQPTRSTTSTIGSSDRRRQVSDRQRLVEHTFKQLFKDDLHAVIPVRNFQAVDELLRRWNEDLQKYIQARALLQLRLEKEGRTRSSFYPEQQQRPTKSNLTLGGGSKGPVPELISVKGTTAGTDSTNGQHRQQTTSAAGTSMRTGMQQQQQEFTAAAPDSPRPRTAAKLTTSSGTESMAPPGLAALKLPEMPAGSFSGSDEPSRIPRLAPLKPRPVMPETVMTRPRLVTQDEQAGTTAFGRCCASVVGALSSEKPEAVNSVEATGDVRAVTQQLEEQRQALVDLEASILEAQKEVLSSPDTGSFIVLFKTPAAATLAARSTVFPQSSNSLEAFKVQPAPSPEDVLWQNMWKSPAMKRDESFRCIFWYALLYLVPTGIFTAALNSISYGICNSQAARPKMIWFCDSKLLQFIFTIILPMVLLMLWQNAVIPSNLYKLELRRAAAVSLSEMEKNILLIYVGWELVNLFLGGVLSASLTSQIKILTDNPDQWARLLGAAFPNSSNFFLNYVITRAFMMNLFRLIMPHGGMWRWIGQMLFTGAASFNHAATERYRAFIIYPASIRYGREPGLILLILLMGIAYSVAAPLITPFVLAYFCTAYLVWRYQMIYVCVRCYESGGKMWPVYFVIVLWCLGLFVVFTSCILIFKGANLQGVLALPLLPTLYLFARHCSYTYSSRVDHPPLWLAHEAPRTEIDPLVYTPPCLQPHAQGWYFEMGKAWVRWGSPAYLDPTI